uniref:Uncharacterized protein n=1 Tax=Glossina austeni TaxID=7395 RepID=A0A1A9VV81_GLOAU
MLTGCWLVQYEPSYCPFYGQSMQMDIGALSDIHQHTTQLLQRIRRMHINVFKLMDVDKFVWVRRSLFTPKSGAYITNHQFQRSRKKTVTYSPIGTRTLRGQIHTMIWVIILIIHYFGQTEISNFDFATNIAFGE